MAEQGMADKSDLSQTKGISWSLDVTNLTPSHFVKTAKSVPPPTTPTPITKQLTLDEMASRPSRQLERTPRSSKKDRSGSESESLKRKRSNSPNNTGAKSATRNTSTKPAKPKGKKTVAKNKPVSCPQNPISMDGDPPSAPSLAGDPS